MSSGVSRTILQRTPVVRVHRVGRRWIGHRTLGPSMVRPPLVAWSRERLERKARKWVDATVAAHVQARESQYTIEPTADDDE